MNDTQRIAEYLGRTRSNPTLNFSPAMLNLTRSLAPTVTANKLIKDFSASTAVGGKRGFGYRQATLTRTKPANYIPHGQRKNIVDQYKADRRRLGKIPKGKNAYVAAGGKFPQYFDVNPSLEFDVYEALCSALDVPLGTFVDSMLFAGAKSGLSSPGFSPSELQRMNAELGLVGDAKLEYNTGESFVNHPNGRMFGVPYENRLRGSVLTVLGVIPKSSRNLNEVLSELDGQQSITSQGISPQSLSRITSLAQRRSELAPLQTTSPSTTIEESPLDLETASDDEIADGDSEDTPSEKPKSKKGLIIGGAVAAVLIIGGASYYLLKK